jgi:hypothetical protein
VLLINQYGLYIAWKGIFISSNTLNYGCKRVELLVSLLEIGSNKLDSCSNRLLNKLLVNTKIKLDY